MSEGRDDQNNDHNVEHGDADADIAGDEAGERHPVATLRAGAVLDLAHADMTQDNGHNRRNRADAIEKRQYDADDA